MKPFDYVRPTSFSEALTLWAEHGDSARLLAGGTDLNVALRHGKITTALVIDLKDVAELQSQIRIDGDALYVSAGATMTELWAFLKQNNLFPSLQAAAAVVGSIQIRNRATLIGNICNASPAADTVPVLAALGTRVEISGPDGTRSRPVEEFIQGNRKIDLGRGEIVTSVRIKMPSVDQGCAFDRITRRRGVDLATANMCCVVNTGGDVTFAFGAVSPRPLVLRDSSGVFHDRTATDDDRARKIQQLAEQASPISDVRASAEYRSAMLCVMATRSLKVAQARLVAGGVNA